MMTKDSLSKIDYILLFIIFLLGCVSYIAISNAPGLNGGRAIGSAHRQIFWYVLGFIVFAGFSFLDYERLKRMHWLFYGFGLFMLFGLTLAKLGLPIPLANQTNGAWSWYSFTNSIKLEPAEFVKIFLILSLAAIIDKHNEMYPIRTAHEDWLLLRKIAYISLPPFALIFIQPDLGSALVLFSIIVCMTVVSGIHWKFISGILSTIVAGLIFFAIAWFKFPQLVNIVLEAHQRERFYAWTNPYQYSSQAGFQLIQSLNSIGSGQFFHHGYNPAITLPEGNTDFIFAIIGGTYGFLGAVIVILLYFLLLSRIVRTASGTHDPFGSYICTGIIGLLMFQIFENIGMTIQVMPITGITLPFLSYGGSSLISSMICMGLVQSVRMQTHRFMFS